MSRIIDFFSDLIWGGGNPATDTYHEDWSRPSSRNTGSRIGEVAQSPEEFIAAIRREQISAEQQSGGGGDSSGTGVADSTAARSRVAAAVGR